MSDELITAHEGHQCLSAGSLIRTLGGKAKTEAKTSGHQCLSAGSLIRTQYERIKAATAILESPMPFGWESD